ncbi:MAG TPA: DUF6152 family protein [Gammaproteobacteria bacterium]|nr:DUF6152 family protein [Gammaproteobacteria bacterium]
MRAIAPSIAAVLLCTSLQASAHHTFIAQYDPDKPVTMTGTVTRVEWTNPHARFYIDVADTAGAVTNWNFELASPNVLRRYGWTGKSLQPGDRVTVDGTLARNGTKMANALTVTLADGRKIFARESAPVLE